MDIEAARFIGAGLALFSLFGVGLALGNIFSSWISSVARNPSAANDVRQIGMMGFALTEAVALFALVVSFLILFK